MKKIFCITFSMIAMFSGKSYGALLKVSCKFEDSAALDRFNLVTSINTDEDVIHTQALISVKNKGPNSQESDPELVLLTGTKQKVVEEVSHSYLVLHLLPIEKTSELQELFLQVGSHKPNASVLQTKNKKIYRSNCIEVL
jgi:hypothetical protein